MSSRPRRSAAIAALEKIHNIVKEAEKYDDYGEEFEDTEVFIKTPSVSVKTEPVEEKICKKPTDVPASPSTASEPTATPSVSVPVITEPVKTTPNTLFGIASAADNLKYNAYDIYVNDFKEKHVANIKKYLNLCDDANMKYIAIPELIKYLIANPALLIHHSAFATAVVNKMVDFENELPIANKIGSYTMTEDYRKQLLSLIKILKKTSIMYSKLKTMANKEFYDNIETIAKDF